MAAKLPNIQELNTLNFSLGIRAKEINDNFDLIRYWIEAERLRIGGWGLVEGFELTKDIQRYSTAEGWKYWNATIHVGAGILINEQGQEVHVAEHTENCMPPRYTPVREVVKADAYGLLNIKYPVYSKSFHHVAYYIPEEDQQELDPGEIVIKIRDTETQLGLYTDIEWIAGNQIKLTSNWANQEFDLAYDYSDDRIDGIFVKHDGSRYIMELGIISTSPSEEKVQDYLTNGWYLVGFAYWHIGREVDVEFFTADRTLRRVYVNKNNILYLNGKPYSEKTVIYFEEPDPPQENDLWYDVEREILYIWRPRNGKYQWIPVNDLARTITNTYTFHKNENPEDLQTFLFESCPELNFMPGRNQLMIIIDQVVIMQDQYDELYSEGGENHYSGYGFRLKYPLERPSIVEVRVQHSLNTRYDEEDMFQHNWLFREEGEYVVADTDTGVLYDMKCTYASGQKETEIYKNGLRLMPGVHYAEVRYEDEQDADEEGQQCGYIRLLQPPEIGDVISFRVLRQVTGFADLKAAFHDYETRLMECEQALFNPIEADTGVDQPLIAGIKQNIGDLQAHVTNILARLADAEDTVTSMEDNKMDTDTVFDENYLDNTVRKGIINGKIEMNLQTNSSSIFLEDVSPDDFLTIAYIKNNLSDPILLLRERYDYSLAETEGGSYLHLAGKWLNDAQASVYITGLRLGV